jgi:hypothetical protein
MNCEFKNVRIQDSRISAPRHTASARRVGSHEADRMSAPNLTESLYRAEAVMAISPRSYRIESRHGENRKALPRN